MTDYAMAGLNGLASFSRHLTMRQRSTAVMALGVSRPLTRQAPRWGLPGGVLAVSLVLLVGFSVFWSLEQSLTEVLVEFVAGSLLLLIGLWWLEGYGLSPRPVPPASP